METRSEIAPSPSSAAGDEHRRPSTSANAADSAAKCAVSPPASGPTAAADSADVAVVALTTSVRDVPMSAYAIIAPGAAISPASGGSPAICA